MQVIYATENSSTKGTLIHLGWRLYGVDPDIRPTAALADILARYGCDVKIGDRQERFIAFETIEGGDLNLEAVGGSGELTLSGMVRRLTNGYTQVAWAFCTDDSKYMEDVRRHRG